jgi:hypothetical protein
LHEKAGYVHYCTFPQHYTTFPNDGKEKEGESNAIKRCNNPMWSEFLAFYA